MLTIPVLPSVPKVANGAEALDTAVSVTDVENVTGLLRDVIRKWEVRYGFPRPERDQYGNRIYPADQVAQLQLIRRLIASGSRPGDVVGLDLESLQRLIVQVTGTTETAAPKSIHEVLGAMAKHDMAQVKFLLKAALCQQGLSVFVRETIAQLNMNVGEFWLRGNLTIFEEHLYTDAIQTILLESIAMVGGREGTPRILLTTAPGELHTTGLLMANAIFSLEGAECVRLGAQTPPQEIAAAAGACGVDVVGLSFSVALPRRDTVSFLRELRGRLNQSVEIWAGGGGVTRLRRIEGVRFIDDLNKIGVVLRAWRKRKPFTHAVGETVNAGELIGP